jgi:hypothetical protein
MLYVPRVLEAYARYRQDETAALDDAAEHCPRAAQHALPGREMTAGSNALNGLGPCNTKYGRSAAMP